MYAPLIFFFASLRFSCLRLVGGGGGFNSFKINKTLCTSIKQVKQYGIK